jgi:transglutaminase-like putative cysteine protease
MHLPLIMLAALAATPAATPWDGAPFAATPDEIARWAAGHPAAPGASVDYLLEETTLTFDAGGRMSSTYRMVYRPLTAAVVEQGGGVSAQWAPWFEDTPVIRARVVHLDGTAHTLDPATLSRSAAHQDDPVMYEDSQVLRGPLPGLRAGDVVETETVVKERAPFFEAGRSLGYRVGWTTPLRRIHVRVEAPAGLPLRWALLGGLSERPVERTRDGVRSLEWDLRDVPALDPPDELAPPDVSSPLIRLSTGASWAAVAEAYAARVEERLEGANLGAQAREIAGDAKEPTELAQRLLDWVSARVRYTGQELGEASLIPTRPADTLARGYGDCKDLSTLLVGLLRAVGVRAEVAVVRVGLGDLADLPGWQFNHAIVHLPGPRSLWIDPTDPSTPVGELPLSDQDSVALVAARGTTGLVRLPVAGAEVNRLVADREIALPEAGAARAVIEVHNRGIFGAHERSLARRNSAGDLLKRDVTAASDYAPGAMLITATRKGVEQSRGPVDVRYELANAWGYADIDVAEGYCRPDLLLWLLPRRLRTDPAAADAPKNGPAGQDVHLATSPFTAEDRCTVAPPPGFEPAPLPAPYRFSRGPLTFERTAEALPDGRIRIRASLVMAGRRLQDRDARELRGLLFPLARDGVKVKFRRTSTVLLEAGKGRDALEEIRRLIALHPGEARHRVHLAQALRDLGLGAAARSAARDAVDREPRNGWAHRVLATVLASDLLGRELAPGCDIEAAVAAQRRALELEGDSPDTRVTLAILLETGADCDRFGLGAHLDEALALRQAARAMGDQSHDEGLMVLLVHMGRFEEAAAIARDLKEGNRRLMTQLAAAAVSRGGAAAANDLQRMGAEERKAALPGALTYLTGVGRYAEAAELLRAAHAGRPPAEARAVIEGLARVGPVQEAAFDPGTPRAVPLRFLRAVLLPGDRAEALRAVVSDELRAPAFAADLDQLRGMVLPMVRNQAFWVPTQALLDLATVFLQVEADGDDESGYRLRVRSTVDETTLVLFVAREDKAYRLVALEQTPGLLGRRAARLVAAGKLEQARRVLGWGRAARTGSDEGSPGRVLDVLLRAGSTPPDLALAADALSAYAVEPPRDALDRLAQAQRKAENGERKRALTSALAAGLRESRRWQELLELVGSAGPYAGAAFDAQAEALVALRRPDALRSAAEARLARAPGDLAALRALRDAARLQGDDAEAHRVAARILSGGKARPLDFAQAAWTGAFLDPVPEDALQHGRRAAELSESYPELVALATVHAARGEPAEALRVLGNALDRRFGSELTPEAWLVIGRVEEAYGLPVDARAAYARTALPGKGGDAPFDAKALADRWASKL